MKGIQQRLDETNDYLTFSERTVRGMESLFGTVKNWMSSGNYKAGPRSASSASSRSEPSSTPAAVASAPSQAAGQQSRGASAGGSGQVQWSSGAAPESKRKVDYKERLQQVEAEQVGCCGAHLLTCQDQTLDVIGSVVGDLKHMSIAMKTELSTQTRQIDQLQDTVDKTSDRMRNTNRRIQKML